LGDSLDEGAKLDRRSVDGNHTLLVVGYQVRLSVGCERTSGASRAVIRADVIFAVAALVYALAAHDSALVSVFTLVGATILASVAEMNDSAGWWTISYQLSPEDHRSEYLAAFDMVTPLVCIIGPPLMIAVVSVGTFCWLAYAVLFPGAAAGARILLRSVAD
jgi:hypothetical protein